MHDSFFGLQKRPFLAVPTLDRYCPVASQETAFQNCTRAITRGDGPVAVLGGTGLGKSMLCLRIGECFRRSFEVILLASSQICSRRALLQNLLFELRMPYRDLSEGELRLSLLDRLQPSNENPSDGLVLIVDEAQTLSMKLLEELRLITNLTRDGVPRVRLVLCGTLRLEEMLGHPQLESLNQRLACRCYLAPLSQHETLNYLTHKIEICGATIQSTFTEDSMRLIYRATDGIPRLIDQLADQSLRLAAESRQRPVSASIVEAAWASLQQIPLPWSDSGTPIEHHETSIEYGSLSDESENEFPNDELPCVDTNSITLATHGEEPTAIVDNQDTSIDEELSFERPTASTVPSAGMGLSRLAPTINPLNDDSEKSVESQAWDDFVNPSDNRFQTGTIEGYVDEMLEIESDSSEEPTVFPDAADLKSNVSEVETIESRFEAFYKHDTQDESDIRLEHDTTYEVEFSDDQRLRNAYDIQDLTPPIDSTNEAVSNPELVEETGLREQVVSQPSIVLEDLFGSDFDDEVDIRGDSNVSIEATQTNAELDSNLAFEFNSISQSYQDDALEPYAELLDTLSTANLEAMTLDPEDSLGATTIDGPSANASSHEDFEGGLSRQTRSTILSFADLQETHHPFVSDDRDLLIVEDDLPGHASDLDPEVKETAAVQPYKQLFSKLRG